MYKKGVDMIDMKSNEDLLLGAELRRGGVDQVMSDWLPVDTSSTQDAAGDANTFIKARLATLSLLSREEERAAAQKIEAYTQQMALLTMACSRSALEMLLLASCAIEGSLKKSMMSNEERFFVLRREMDDMIKVDGNLKKLKRLMRHSEKLCQPDWRLSAEVVDLICSIDWPRALMFSMANRHSGRGEYASTLQKAIDEYLRKYGDVKSSNAAQADRAHRAQLAYFSRAYLRQRETLVNHNLRLVFHIAKRYTQKNEHLPDLIQEGTFGLIRAVEKYRVSSGFRFSTYAHHWIDSKVRKARVNIDKVMNVSHDYNIDLLRISQCLEQHSMRGIKLSNHELSKQTNISEEKLDAILQLRQFGVSLDDQPGEEDGLSLHAKLADDASDFVGSVMHQRDAEHLNMLMEASLTEREVYIVNERFGRIGDPRTLQELSDILGISRERVRQLETGALKKLSSCIDREGFM